MTIMRRNPSQNQKDLQTKRVAENPSQTTKMVTESVLTTKMVTESALTTKMNAGDLDLGPGPTIKMVTGNQGPMTKTVKESQNDLQTKRVAENPSQTTKMVTERALTTKMATESALTTKMVAGDLSPMVTGNQDPMTKTVKENQKDLQKKRVAGNPSQTTKMVTESALTTRMATGSALTTKMVAGDLGLMMVIKGRTETAKENPDLLTAKKKRVAGNPSQTTKMVTESP